MRHVSDAFRSVFESGRAAMHTLSGRQMTLFSSGLKCLVIAAAVFATAPTILGHGRLLGSIHMVSTEDAYLQADITPISPKVGGYITSVTIEDNQEVKAGDVLFRIEARDYQARVDQAAAGVAIRRAALANLGSRIEFQKTAIERAVAMLNGAMANAERAARDFGRVRELNDSGWTSESKRDEAQANHLAAQARVAEAQADVMAARSQLNVLESERPQLVADIDAASATLKLSQIDLEDTIIRAPADGRVGERQAKLGQYVRPGTLVLAIVSRKVWVVANFKETQLSAMRGGDEVIVSIDGVPGVRFAGRVDSFTPASGAKFALLPPDNATGNFTRIAQRIPSRTSLTRCC